MPRPSKYDDRREWRQHRFNLTYNDACKAARRHLMDNNREIRDAIMKHVNELKRLARKDKLEIPE